MAQNKQSHLIATVKLLNIGFINKYTRIINLGVGGGVGRGVEWGYLVVINYQSLVSNFFSVSPPPPPPFIFLYKDRRNRLLCVNFLELYDFMIY